MPITLTEAPNAVELALLRHGAVAMESLYSEQLTFMFALCQLQRLEPAIAWSEGDTPQLQSNAVAVERSADTYVLRARTPDGQILAWHRASTPTRADAPVTLR